MMKPIRSSRKENERGATLILFTFLTVLVLLPVIGLAIDGAIVMWEKARLVQAVDAAALAAGRSLNVALGDQAQQNTVDQIAETYFQANFQPGQMGATEITPNLDGQQPSPLTSSGGYRKVTVSRSISVPLYFMRMLGFNNTTMEATGQASRKDVNVILVLDRSGSMATPDPNNPNGPTGCDQMKGAAQSFVNMFVDGRDSLGLVTFQTTANADFTPNTTFNTGMNQQLSQLVCAGATSSAWGLSLAYDQIKQRGWIGASNIVVFFSDGYPTSVEYSNANGYNSALPARNQSRDYGDTRYDPIDTSNEYQYPQSPCKSSSITGVLVAWEQYTYSTGYTLGVAKDTPYPISSNAGAYLDVPHLAPAQGCSFTNPSSYAYYQYLPASYQQYYQNNPSILMRYDIAYIPTQDYYGNRTDTTLNPFSKGSNPYWPVVLFPNDGVHFYPGKIRPDVPQNMVYTAFNAADNAAYNIRSDTTYKPVIYSIGLGSDVNDDFMERVANDPRASSYDASKAAGLYIKAPTPAQLQSAFQQIASQILRISQ